MPTLLYLKIVKARIKRPRIYFYNSNIPYKFVLFQFVSGCAMLCSSNQALPLFVYTFAYKNRGVGFRFPHLRYLPSNGLP